MTQIPPFKKCKYCDWSYGNMVLNENILRHIELCHKAKYEQVKDLLDSFIEDQ